MIGSLAENGARLVAGGSRAGAATNEGWPATAAIGHDERYGDRVGGHLAFDPERPLREDGRRKPGRRAGQAGPTVRQVDEGVDREAGTVPEGRADQAVIGAGD